MPQRTNDFQHLVAKIHRHYAPFGAKVTESAMVQDGTGAKREIDILVEYKTGLYPLRVAIEAKDLSRRLDVNSVEAYIGKYNSIGGIQVSQVIIVAKEFTRTARLKAANIGFLLQTIEEIDLGPESYVERRKVSPKAEGGNDVFLPEGLRAFVFDVRGKSLAAIQDTAIFYRAGKRVGRLPVIQKAFNPILVQRLHSLRKEMIGCSLSGALHIKLPGTTMLHHGQVYKVGKLIVASNYGAIMPTTTARGVKFRTNEDQESLLTIETASNEHVNFDLSYEEPQGGIPETINIHTTQPNGSAGMKRMHLVWKL